MWKKFGILFVGIFFISIFVGGFKLLDSQQNQIIFLTDKNTNNRGLLLEVVDKNDQLIDEIMTIKRLNNDNNRSIRNQIRENIILMEENNDLRSRINTEQKIKMNPSYAEVKRFISQDKTDQKLYYQNLFDCTEYSNTLIKNALEEGIFACFIELNIDTDDDGIIDGGHAAVQFMTSDLGIITVEPQNDKFIEVGLGIDWWCYFDKNNCQTAKVLGYSSCFEVNYMVTEEMLSEGLI